MARQKKYTDNKVLSNKVDEYFDQCDLKEKPYTMSGLALALDMDRRSLLNYSKDEKFFPTIKKAKQKVEAQLEENALSNKSNSVFTIFNLKNNFDWKDRQEENEDNNAINNAKEILVKIKSVADDK